MPKSELVKCLHANASQASRTPDQFPVHDGREPLAVCEIDLKDSFAESRHAIKCFVPEFHPSSEAIGEG